MRALFALEGTLRALALSSPKIDAKTVCLQLVARCERRPGTDANRRRRQERLRVPDRDRPSRARDAHIHRPRRKRERRRGPNLAPIRQRIESIFSTAKDIPGLEHRRARVLHQLRVRFAALASALALRLGRVSRSLAGYTA